MGFVLFGVIDVIARCTHGYLIQLLINGLMKLRYVSQGWKFFYFKAISHARLKN